MKTVAQMAEETKGVKVLLTLPEANMLARLLDAAVRLEEFASVHEDPLDDFAEDIVAIVRDGSVAKFVRRFDYRIRCAGLEVRRILGDNTDVISPPRQVDLD